MNKEMILLAAALGTGAVYALKPDFFMAYYDTFIVGFAGLAYVFYVRPWIKAMLYRNSEGNSE
ncbi:MAG: hypothetical protein MI749_01580 [Desulfovibrionales bacterium]|nr:hypothetical protein [Desulfovibrionales bacterium]